ncbi:MAG: spore cortex biosynthesis protein YabQ [Clostridia bacterium]|nr:spore cortex biosynthesis protein YabQ [Clostridia bacterium]
MDSVIKDFLGLDITHQITTFFVFSILGVVFCVVYDFYRAIRYEIDLSKPVIFFADIFFVLFITIIIFFASLVRSNGQIRIFALFGCFLGWLVIRYTVSKWICKFFRIIISAIKRVIKFIKNKILTPIRVKIPLCFKRINAKVKFIKNKYVKYSKKDKKHLQKDKDIVYNQKDKRRKRKNAKKTNEVPRSERNTFY